MASRPRGYGIAADEKRKIDSKYSLEEENRVRQWIEAVIQEPLVPGSSASPLGQEKFAEALKDGSALCKVLHKLDPSFRLPKVDPGKFRQMEAIEKFLKGCLAYGLQNTDTFQVVDLYEAQNLHAVICTVTALGRKAQAKDSTDQLWAPRNRQKM